MTSTTPNWVIIQHARPPPEPQSPLRADPYRPIATRTQPNTATADRRRTLARFIDQQADVTALDGQFFTPLITAALDRARSSTAPQLAELAKNPRIAEAVGRLSRWNQTYPTGIPEGYDSSDRNGRLSTPSQQEIDNSVAATLYVLWRGRYIGSVIDKHVAQISPQLPEPGDFDSVKALKQLMVDFDTRKGIGRSGIDDALTLAASDNFASAFNRSTDQSTYRWGKLHRITLPSPIGAPYSIPSQGNRFTSPLPGLPGIPVDGGFNVPDIATHNLRADTPDKFTVALGPARRFVAQPTAIGMRSVNSLNGGASEDLGSKFEQNLLRSWLTNDTYPVRLYPQDLIGAIDSVTLYLPGSTRSKPPPTRSTASPAKSDSAHPPPPATASNASSAPAPAPTAPPSRVASSGCV